MASDYNLKNVQKVVTDFFKATSVNISILDSDFNVIYMNKEYSNKYCLLLQSSYKKGYYCYCSDVKLLNKCKETKSPQQHICYAGLIDIAIPIMHEFEIIGYIMIGQLKYSDNLDAINIKTTKAKLENFKEEYNKLTLSNQEKIESTINIAIIVAKYLLLENIIKPKRSKNLETVIDFINENLSENLSIENISKQTFLSKSLIYILFRKYFNMTVSEYINIQRIKRAKQLLNGTELTVESVSAKVGYSSSSYFSKTFKKIVGVSPKQYSEENKI